MIQANLQRGPGSDPGYDEEDAAFLRRPATRHQPRGHGRRIALVSLASGGALVASAPWVGGPHAAALALAGLALSAISASVYFWLAWNRVGTAGLNESAFFRSARSRGAMGWLLGLGMTAFYVVLYWMPQWLAPLTRLLDPLSLALAGRTADHWFLYGLVYTTAVTVFGVRMIARHRSNRYQIWRTCSVVAFQVGFAFLLPHVLELFRQPEYYLTYFWPLKWDYLFPHSVQALREHPGGLGVFLVAWSGAASFLVTPILTYLYGKRWYCSWVCGCGGLAETLGDPFRHLSDKSSRAWHIERVSIYSVLALICVTTATVWLSWSGAVPWLEGPGHTLSRWYGFAIGAVFSGVVGVGFYPLLGSRVWCRFGCPMAAILGLQQRLWSRFRITTNGGQCMSCGNCSTHCEMGIDVRSYAQSGLNIVRASCVGCGICSAVCPRGVLKLENGPVDATRFGELRNRAASLPEERPRAGTSVDEVAGVR